MPSYEQTDWYDLPLYYDIVYDEDSAEEAAFIEAMFDRHIDRPDGRILEPACGTGRLMATLGQRGFEVSGFDISEPMLAFARERLREAGVDGELKRAGLDDFRFRKRFDLAHCLVSSFKYLLSEEAALEHLRRVAGALRPGGIYLLGLHLTDYDDRQRARERWTGKRDGIYVVNNLQSWPPDARARRERLRSRLIVQQAGRTDRYETQWHFRTYSAGQLKRLLAKVPEFEHIATHDFLYEADERTTLTDEGLDKILVLRRRAR